MRNVYYLFFVFCMAFTNSCSNIDENSLVKEEGKTENIQTRAAKFNVGRFDANNLTQSSLSSVGNAIYQQLMPVEGIPALNFTNMSTNKAVLKLKIQPQGHSAYYVVSQMITDNLCRITLKSSLNDEDFNELIVKVQESPNQIDIAYVSCNINSLSPIYTRGMIDDVIKDLRVRADRWWPCYKGFWTSDIGLATSLIGTFGGKPGFVFAAMMAGVGALGCFG